MRTFRHIKGSRQNFPMGCLSLLLDDLQGFFLGLGPGHVSIFEVLGDQQGLSDGSDLRPGGFPAKDLGSDSPDGMGLVTGGGLILP